MIVADTTVWVDHLRQGVPALAQRLERGEVHIHPFIIGELACGNLRARDNVLELLHQLPTVPIASDKEALLFLEQNRLMGRGIGWVDVHLLASTALAGVARLWTTDRRLADVASSLGLA